MKELDLDRAFVKTTASFHNRMESALRTCKEDAPMKRFPLRTGLLAVLIITLLAGTAYAIVTHYSVRDYYTNKSEEFQKSITLVDKSYENEYFSLYVTDAAFDGQSIFIAMDITPKEGADPVYLYPILTATSEGKELPVDIEGCSGNFFSGFFVPDKEMDLQGKYGVNACIYEAEAEGDVNWQLSFMVLKPNWELAFDAVILRAGESDSYYNDYIQRFKDAYAQKKILLARGYDLNEFSSILPTPNGMTDEEFQGVRGLGPTLALSEAFTLIETLECTWTAPLPASYKVTNTGDKLEFDDYTIVMGKVTTSFMKVTWAFDVYFKNETGEEAGISFEACMGSKDVYTLGSGSPSGFGPSDDGDPTHYTYGGELAYSGELPDVLTFVPYTTEYRVPTKEDMATRYVPKGSEDKAIIRYYVYNESNAFEVKLK